MLYGLSVHTHQSKDPHMSAECRLFLDQVCPVRQHWNLWSLPQRLRQTLRHKKPNKKNLSDKWLRLFQRTRMRCFRESKMQYFESIWRENFYILFCWLDIWNKQIDVWKFPLNRFTYFLTLKTCPFALKSVFFNAKTHILWTKKKGLFKISNDFNSQAVYYTHVTNKKRNNIDFCIIKTLNPIRNCNDLGFLTLSNQL